MNMMYDARNPAPGVVVLSCPASRAQGLPFAQAKNARHDDTAVSWHVLKPTKRCEPTGLGLPSTIRTLPHHVLPTTGAPLQTVRPGTRRRGHGHHQTQRQEFQPDGGSGPGGGCRLDLRRTG